jgi:putative oxidoreductase
MILQKYETHLYTAFRAVTGFLFLWHGSQKLFGYPPAGGPIPLNIVAIGGTVEFFGGLFVMIGLFTHWAAFIASGEMAYAYWTAHAPHALLPIVNHGELAVLYCFAFLYIAAHGAGAFSCDSYLDRRRGHRKE